MAIKLSKGQTVDLAKPGGLDKISFGVGWDVAKGKGFLGSLFGGGSIDLDASCILFDSAGNRVDQVWWKQLESQCGGIQHLGDNTTGEGDGDDEVIHVNLKKLKPEINSIVLTVSSFQGQTFEKVENAFCRVLDQSNKPLATYNLSEQGQHTAILLGVLKRKGSDWDFTAVGKATNGRTIDDLQAEAKLIL